MRGIIVAIGIIAVLGIAIAYPIADFYKTKEVTIMPAFKFIDPDPAGPYYIVTDKNGYNIELGRQIYNLQDNIDSLYVKVDGHIANNHTVVYECYGWDNQGLHWYYNCYKELKVMASQ